MHDLEAKLRAQGWQRDLSGVWTRPADAASAHAHSASCTADSCGEEAFFFCPGGDCLRSLRRDGERRQCPGHRVPSRTALIEYSLTHRGLTKSAPRGAPLEDDDERPNTWSTERDVAPAMPAGTR